MTKAQAVTEVLTFRPSKLTLISLRVFPLVYIATPYRNFPGGLEVAYEAAVDLTGRLQVNGLSVFCPIVHGHPTSKRGHTNALDHAFWMRVDKAFMRVCNALLVAEMEGWKQSGGIKEEIQIFEQDGKPIYYINPNSLAVRQ